jgi:hypothetical protein
MNFVGRLLLADLTSFLDLLLKPVEKLNKSAGITDLETGCYSIKIEVAYV